MNSSAHPGRSSRGLQAALAVHAGTLRKANMAAVCVRTLCKVGRSLFELPGARRPGILSYPPGNITSHGFGRTYSSVRTAVQAGRGRILGCAFLLGGGLGFYQAVRFSLHQNLAQDESQVSPSSQAEKNPYFDSCPWLLTVCRSCLSAQF